MMLEHNFTGRCPSLAQIKSKVKLGVTAGGSDWIQLTWGENQITLEYMYRAKRWVGHGWIRRTSGYDLAMAINKGEFNVKPAQRSDDPRDLCPHPTVVHKF